MDRKYVLLLPAPTPPPGDAASTPPLASEVAHIQKRRRVGGSGACHNCRRRKTRCDGQQPSCQSCLSREEECRYKDDLNQTDGVLVVETIRLLNDRPPEAAVQALAMLKHVDDPASIMSHLRAEDGMDFALPEQPSDRMPISGALPACMVALELQTQHPFAYPPLSPIDIENPGQDLQRLLKSCGADFPGHPRPNANPSQQAPISYSSAIDPEASDLVNAFCTEAETLWETQRIVPSTVNMAAALFLSFGYLVQGKDHNVLAYMPEVVRMGTELGLFGVEQAVAEARMDKMTPQQLKAASHTTWGVFNWIMLMALFYYQSDIDYPHHPPYLPIPEDDDVSGVGPSQGPGPDSPRYVGDTFPTVCRLWRIMHEVAMAYGQDRSTPIRDRMSLEFSEFKFRELLAWTDNLPFELVRSEQSPHHVVIFHIWLHAAILDIFRPFIRRHGQAKLRLRTFSPPMSSPDQIYAASVNQLKRLIIIYRLNHESSAFTIVWHTAMLYVANAVLQDPGDGDWLFYFLLCIYGYETLGRCYPVVEAIMGALLSMAIRNGHMTSDSAREIWAELKSKGPRRAPQVIHATFMADLELAMDDPSAATVENLAGMLEENALMDQYTNFFEMDGL
ncbi:hypothetical protein G7Z17_g3247 [Cylindrodendrum hubeiense]|uniref:Zn(2)-C6 fungal-type domain-containing protein n=1 Tax=Cylindrodendrum hubeiense TaxID=595255 RepID=A0A9P5LJL2_9HYPO|nr:hypothetical protein G7Z17_g3247 [Cylindrodendrum hubeiense]